MKQNAIQSDYPYVTKDEGHFRNFSSFEENQSIQKIGEKSAVNILVQINKKHITGPCQGLVEGFKVHLHLPYEMPRLRNNYFRVALHQRVLLAVRPNVSNTSDGFQKYDIQKKV